MSLFSEAERKSTGFYSLVLICVAVAWGLTGPLSKLAVSSGNHPVGVTFWDTIICAAVLSIALVIRRRGLPLSPRYLIFYLVCGFLGTALPNSLSYTAYQYLPVGVNVMILSLVPMATLLISWPLGVDQANPRRLIGLLFGIAAVLMIALPETSLPSPEQAVWVILPVIVSLSYAAENVFIARCRPPQLDALGIVCALNYAALLLLVPVVEWNDAWFDITRFGPAEQATVAVALLHVVAYMGFVWLIDRAGPVFASQVGYIVTGIGVLLGVLIYDERHSYWVWAALALIFIGLSLVRPRRKRLSDLVRENAERQVS